MARTGRAGGSRGTLHVVGTPIGNLEDLSPRALRAIAQARLVACEDTRVTRGLLTRHGVGARLISCHRFSEAKRLERVLEVLREGADVALVTDGGTPAISDPGAILVRRAREEGHRVIPVPGPSSITAIYSVSGFRATSFTFIGFLPSRKGERRRALESLRREPRPLLFFEAPHRLLGALEDAIAVLGDRRAFLAREMTKIHEEFLSGTLRSVLAAFRDRAVRGEIAFVVEGADRATAEASETGAPADPPGIAALRLIAEGWDRKEALRRVARERRLSRRAVYQDLLRRGRGGREGKG
ncbi:MAG: 16S rRNA (cytidine(1402)-2'-O)-methyltransferase [Acidobacteriota bacterium]